MTDILIVPRKETLTKTRPMCRHSEHERQRHVQKKTQQIRERRPVTVIHHYWNANNFSRKYRLDAASNKRGEVYWVYKTEVYWVYKTEVYWVYKTEVYWVYKTEFNIGSFVKVKSPSKLAPLSSKLASPSKLSGSALTYVCRKFGYKLSELSNVPPEALSEYLFSATFVRIAKTATTAMVMNRLYLTTSIPIGHDDPVITLINLII
ncbi:hypothetical protein HELRODRAFT_176517 [Helobdella robusta]|uniref:Uncharacterized protein n=1 Tax=Helobdella robusta TaxID=6412 RepID=T1FAL7_HELRO|nr:hypothetical protein HELRODRAFT_176517 [Helobdella robusta]ESN99755.1 hypothetical protein HELRODRAFT_176517 [Helobdella robusta]